MPNRLAREKSPYLLQHAGNPVDWFPWGDEAFAKARRERKPIFLSIGYSTCHWCHVMEHESFENDAVAERLNRDFVPIKVDREERPDVDRVYMAAMQAMGMGGGWPLNAFLTPDLEPFFGGTYFPPRSVPGRPGMIEVLERVHEVWREQPDALRDEGRRVLASLADDAPGRVTDLERGTAREDLIERCAGYFERAYDSAHGGFSDRPKFPSVVNLVFLMRWWARDRVRHAHALAMVRGQLDAMRAGGIHDHLGGGFHRYATDETWLVPHFEKMLYDQAQLAWAYLEAFQATGEPAYAATARGIFAYVARDLTSPGGAFDSAEDADSEGEEGRFYVWTPDEITSLLGDDAAPFAARYGVSARGNFEDGTSILHEARPLDDVAREAGLTPGDLAVRLARARATLFAAREKRVRPHRDDKVLTAWNGLMISAFARGARVLGDADLATRAVRAAEFVWGHVRADAGGLMRRWRDGEAAGAGQLDDYAYLALGCVDLYQARFDPIWLERAAALVEAMLARFRDAREGGLFESPDGDPSIRVRMKDGFDGAEIAGSSIAHLVLVTLGTLLDRRAWLDEAERGFEYHARRLAAYPAAMPMMLAA
ncbi:MAG: thioredoxin domain-containing protein, partial [Candidatus Eisenbacteria bacterium]|nr:thioredoxin domain-containing protein [Candidatus Eisenbacteria bacterium]